MARFSRNTTRRSSLSFLTVIILLLAAGGVYAYVTFFEGTPPLVNTINLPSWFGEKTSITMEVGDSNSGLRSVKVSIIQANNEKELFAKEFPKKSKTTETGNLPETITLEIDTKKLGLKEGEALLKIEAADYSLRRFMKGNITLLSFPVTIDTLPPKITIIHSERYIIPGGAGIVIYKVDNAERHGVRLNDNFFPGFPLIDESAKKYIAYIALPYDQDLIEKASVSAQDSAGNTAEISFAPIVKTAIQKRDHINVGDGFLAKKIPEFQTHYPEMEGEMVEKYLYVNSKIRTMNNKTIHDLCMNPEPKQLWSGNFLRMAGSGRAGFADHRTYNYKGNPIDKQVHLGMDIASVQHAAVKASGTGKVVYNDFLGIYGNMVMLDHGQGVFTLYSHLSQANVSVGDTINKGDVLGRTGTSGMAGGDHLHFSVLINGIFVTPKEWWDQHWIDVTINNPITDAKF